MPPKGGVQKILQKQLYSFVGSNWGIVVIVLGCFWCLNSILQLLQLALSGPIASPTCIHCCQHNYADNLAESTFEGRLCLPQVDVVYTWVNGSDEKLQRDVAYWKPIFLKENGLPNEDEDENVSLPITSNSTQDEHLEQNPSTDGRNRFRDNQELRYSLRSIWRFAPWVRHVYILTNGQIPYWLNTDHPRLTMVSHSDVIKRDYLPTFSSPAIETGLHKIPGIANYFIYFNDDVMLGNSIWPDDFYTHSSGQKVFLSWAVPNCAPGCPDTWQGDKYCDAACNTLACNWDGGDCVNHTAGTGGTTVSNRWSGNAYAGSTSGAQDYCSSGCPNNWLGDKVCDRSCKTVACAFDAGDCGVEDLQRHVPGYFLDENMESVILPRDSNAFYVNITAVFGESVLDASHTNGPLVRAAVITKNTGILAVLLYPYPPSLGNLTEDSPSQLINFLISGNVNGQFVEAEFNVTRLGTNSSEGTNDFNPSPVRISWQGPPTPMPSLAPSPPPAAEEPLVETVVLGHNASDASPKPARSRRRRKPVPIAEDTPTGARRLLSVEVPIDLFKEPQSIAESVVVENLVDEEGSLVYPRDFTEEYSQLIDEVITQKRKQLLMDSIKSADEYRDTLLELLEEEFGEVFPWELEDKLKGLQHLPTSRRLLIDTFADSLRYVNSLYNKVFGKENRKMPAHMPHFIDKRIQEELYARWPERFDETASHKFRHSHDMQFAFSYFYFMMQSKLVFDPKKVFDQLDADGDGELSYSEVEYLTMVMNSENNEKFKVEEVYGALINTSLSSPLGGLSPYANHITFEVFTLVPDVIRKLKFVVEKKPKYPHQEMGSEEIEFYMVGNDVEKVTTRLQELRTKGPKFICLNDDMNKTHDPDPQLLIELQKFYTGYFPKPCPFELPDGVHNEFRSIDDLRASRRQHVWSYVGVGAVVACLCFLWLFPQHTKSLWRNCETCYGARRRGDRFVTV